MSQQNRPKGHDQFTVWDPERENAHHYDSRGDADEKMDMAADLGIDAELFPPGESPEALYHGDSEATSKDHSDESDESSTVPCEECGEPVTAQEADFGADKQPYHPDCLTGEDDNDPEPETPDESPEKVEAEMIDHAPDAGNDHTPEYDDLPDRSVSEDPLNWVPGEFVDTIDGTQAINRKGFEVLSHFYDIDVHSTVVVPPEETEHEYCRVQAVATTPDGRECQAHGSAHVDRGDDHYLLLEMADTRARKRALSIATGVGAVAVEELRNEVQE